MIYKKPRGTEDIYENIDLIKWIEDILIKTVQLYNFYEVRTPIFENKALFLNSVGDSTDIVSKEMFFLESRNKEQYALKPEGTASVIRFIIENKLYDKYILPLKLFYLQSMFRYERPQKGRLRQFNQFGVEIVGSDNILIDLEQIILAANLLNNLNIKNYKVHINSLGNFETRKKYKEALVKALSNVKKCSDCNLKIKTNPLRIMDCKKEKFNLKEIPKIYDFLTETDRNNLNFIIENLKKYNIIVELDNNLVRGLDYYTSIIFEIILNNDNEKNFTLCGGGRYDTLVQNLGGKNCPAFGFAIGIERIRIVLRNIDQNLFLNNKKLDIFFISLNKDAQIKSLELAELLRKENYIVQINFDEALNIKKQFKIADKLVAKFIIIIGQKELEKDIVIVKNNTTKKVEEINMKNIVKYFHKKV